MITLRLPRPASSATLQLALTRALESASAYKHAAGISRSEGLKGLCRGLLAERKSQAQRLARLIQESGGTPDFNLSWEANFQQLWMTLIDRRAPDAQAGPPRECERADRRLERVLLSLWHDPATGARRRQQLDLLVRELRGGFRHLPHLRAKADDLETRSFA